MAKWMRFNEKQPHFEEDGYKEMNLKGNGSNHRGGDAVIIESN
jgi:hypothetical protein